MPITDSLYKISNQLTNFSEVELIYCTINDDNNSQRHMIYTVVCNLESVIENEKLLKSYLAAKEILETLYSKANIEIIFNLMTTKEFEINAIENRDYYQNELKNSNIIYSDNEFLTSIINKHTR